jgi:hypothetical protein
MVSAQETRTRTAPTPTGWVGWIGFAATILLLSGLFSIVQGLAALIGPDTYYASVEGSLVIFDVQGWGWTSLIFGVLMILAGGALLSGRTWARIAVVVLAIISATAALLMVPAQPWWSLILIALDVLVIYAVVAHGDELREA